jgi:cytochrome oxidase assembly protein ShyY1
MTRRRLVGSLVALLAAAACVWLGSWQWDRSRTELPGTTETVATAVPLADALAGRTSVSAADGQRPVTVVGRYDPDQQRVVIEGGGPGLDALVVPLLPADGSAAVVTIRGTVPTGSTPPAPPASTVEVTGWLRAAEPIEGSDLVGLAPGELPAFSPVPYLADVDYPLLDATIAVAEQRPPAAGVTPLPPPRSEQATRMNWRSLGYSLQWFVLIGLIGYLWWRHAWREPQEQQA